MLSPAVRRLPLLACSLTLGLLLAGVAHADDALNDAAARREIAAQKVEKCVKEDLVNAADLAKSSPEGAVAVLKLTRDFVADDKDLTPERRQQLLDQINGRMKEYSQRPSSLPPNVPNPRRTDEDARIREADRIKKDPSSPANIASRTIGDRKTAITEGHDQRDRQAVASTKAINDVVKTSIPTVKDVEFPDDWEKRVKDRAEVKLTEKEITLMKALNTPIKDLDFDKMKLTEVLQYLKDKTGQGIDIPKAIMEEVGITYETPVTAHLGTVTLRSVLKKVLGDLNLTYIIKDGTIQVTTPERAKQTYSVRAYYVGDLATAGNVALGPIGQRIAMAQSIQLIMQTIVSTIEPDSWQANNKDAAGTIFFNPLNMTIVVKQTAEMHLMLGVGMRR